MRYVSGVRRLARSPGRHHELGEAYRLRQPPRVAHYCPSTARKRQPPTFCSHTHTLHGVSRGSHDTRETWRRGAAMRRRAAPSCRAAPRCSAAPCCRTEPCYRAAPCCRAARCVASAPISCGHSAQCTVRSSGECERCPGSAHDSCHAGRVRSSGLELTDSSTTTSSC